MRYLGGKYRVARELSTLIHTHATYAKTSTTLYEPFMGGGNMSARLGNKYQHVHYSDIHGPLIALWQHVLLTNHGTTDGLPDTVSREEYYDMKKNQTNTPECGFIGFAASFGGQWFNSYASLRKNKDGTPSSTIDETHRSINKWAPRMLGQETTTITHQPYTALTPEITDATIYCDPPYAGTTGYKTGKFDHQKFWDWARTMSTHNSVFISEYTAPDDFVTVWQKTVHSTINSRTNNSPRLEKLFIHQDSLERLGFTPTGDSMLNTTPTLFADTTSPVLP